MGSHVVYSIGRNWWKKGHIPLPQIVERYIVRDAVDPWGESIESEINKIIFSIDGSIREGSIASSSRVLGCNSKVRDRLERKKPQFSHGKIFNGLMGRYLSLKESPFLPQVSPWCGLV